MNIQTISMDPRIARIHYLDYRKRCARNREQRAATMAAQAAELGAEAERVRAKLSQLEKEDEQLLKAYRALYRGQQILDLPKTIARGGLDAKALPRLAVCKANEERCKVFLKERAVYFAPGAPWSLWNKRDVAKCLRFDRNLPSELTDYAWRSAHQRPTEATALVPTVPPHLRPDDLAKYYILWEAEWTAKAPVDPILLSRVNDTMFAVVAQWDLTPLEQSVLEGRL
jgi:hypothetical protein